MLGGRRESLERSYLILIWNGTLQVCTGTLGSTTTPVPYPYDTLVPCPGGGRVLNQISRLLCASWFQLNICILFIWCLVFIVNNSGSKKSRLVLKNKEEIPCIMYHVSFFFFFHILMFALVGSYIGRRDTVHG